MFTRLGLADNDVPPTALAGKLRSRKAATGLPRLIGSLAWRSSPERLIKSGDCAIEGKVKSTPVFIVLFSSKFVSRGIRACLSGLVHFLKFLAESSKNIDVCFVHL